MIHVVVLINLLIRTKSKVQHGTAATEAWEKISVSVIQSQGFKEGIYCKYYYLWILQISMGTIGRVGLGIELRDIISFIQNLTEKSV